MNYVCGIACFYMTIKRLVGKLKLIYVLRIALHGFNTKESVAIEL